HPIVGDDEVHLLLREHLQRLGHTLRPQPAMAGTLQGVLQDEAYGGLVVDMEDRRHLAGERSARGKMQRTETRRAVAQVYGSRCRYSPDKIICPCKPATPAGWLSRQADECESRTTSSSGPRSLTFSGT